MALVVFFFFFVGESSVFYRAGGLAEGDALAEEAAKGEVLVPKGAYDEYYGTYQARLQEARNLVDQYDPSRLTAADYTEESWKAYEAAWETLRSDVNYTFSGGTWADYRMIGQFPNHISALTNARLHLAGEHLEALYRLPRRRRGDGLRSGFRDPPVQA